MKLTSHQYVHAAVTNYIKLNIIKFITHENFQLRTLVLAMCKILYTQKFLSSCMVSLLYCTLRKWIKGTKCTLFSIK